MRRGCRARPFARGAGRPRIEQSQPGIKKALERLVDPLPCGAPQSPLRWTCKGRAKLAAALSRAVWKVSSTPVGRLLHELGYRLQSVRKSPEGASHPDRNAQFDHINAKADECLQRARPVVSVDTKKKELVGDFKNAGREWQPKGQPEKSMVHDFPQDAAGKAIPYGIYDMGRNDAWVSVGCDHDTPAFALASLRRWWEERGRSRYPEARELFITADAGAATATACARGSRGYSNVPTTRECAYTSATSRPAPASGTRLSTACSVTSRTIGEASHCDPSKPSLI